jgi:hypothetical protein
MWLSTVRGGGKGGAVPDAVEEFVAADRGALGLRQKLRHGNSLCGDWQFLRATPGVLPHEIAVL